MPIIESLNSSETASGFSAAGNVTLVGSGLYGMTIGGANTLGNVFGVGVNSTNYQNLISFTGSGGTASGANPQGSLTLVGSGLYGMTNGGGADSYGNVFSVGTDGTSYQELYDFTGGTDGAFPLGDLTLSNGTLFGMTDQGGASGVGTVFALALPAPTPEPGTLALAGGGAALVLAAQRWRRRQPRRGQQA